MEYEWVQIPIEQTLVGKVKINDTVKAHPKEGADCRVEQVFDHKVWASVNTNLPCSTLIVIPQATLWIQRAVVPKAIPGRAYKINDSVFVGLEDGTMIYAGGRYALNSRQNFRPDVFVPLKLDEVNHS